MQVSVNQWVYLRWKKQPDLALQNILNNVLIKNDVKAMYHCFLDVFLIFQDMYGTTFYYY